MSQLFIITGPSGVGKSFLIEKVMTLFPDSFVTPPVVTTRPPRAGEQPVDRHFVTVQEFRRMQEEGAFAVADEFQGHWYGFPASAVLPSDKHVIFNTWPAPIPAFMSHASPVFIGMTIPPTHIDLLRRRMERRGDDAVTIARRLKQVQIDMADLAKQASAVNAQGRIFTITDDSTIDTEIIPWITTMIQ